MSMTRLKTFLHEKNEWAIPVLIFAAALAGRLYLYLSFHYPMMIHEQDAAGYIDVARRMLRFRPFFDAIRPPGYPAVIALFAAFPLEIETAARVASIVMDALVVIPLYWLGRRFLPRPAAAGAALLWAFFSFALYFSVSPLSQSTFLFFLTTAVLFLHRALDGGAGARRPFFLSGLLFGCAFLARPEGIVSLTAAAVLVLFSMLPRDGRQQALRGGLAFAVGAGLAAGPYLVFLRLALGYWGVSGKVTAALKSIDGSLTLDKSGNLAASASGYRAWLEHYGSIGGIFSAVQGNVAQFAGVVQRTFPIWFLGLAAAGLLLLLCGRQRKSLLFLLLLPVATLPNYIVNIPKGHSYLYSLFPFLFLLSAVPFAVLFRLPQAERVRRSRAGSALLAAVALVPAAILGYSGFAAAVATFRDPGLVEQALLTKYIYKESGEVLNKITQPGEKIVTRWGLVGYYADRPVINLPKGGIDEVVRFCRKNGGAYMVIDTPAVYSRREELTPLLAPLDGRGIDPRYRLQPVHTAVHPEVGGYVIYRLLP